MKDRLSPESLKYVLAVCDTRSFSAAARACAVTQSALSHSIRGLEETLGGRIFFRTTTGAHLTPFGESILAEISAAVAALDDVLRAASNYHCLEQPCLQVGVSPLNGIEITTKVQQVVAAWQQNNAADSKGGLRRRQQLQAAKRSCQLLMHEADLDPPFA